MGASHQRSKPELLAPAGDRQCLIAAVENGADAIYFGLERHNARIRASNFEGANLPEIMALLHRRGVCGYVTLNTLVFPHELAELEALDNGKPVTNARRDDVGGSINMFRYMAGWATRLNGEQIPVSTPGNARNYGVEFDFGLGYRNRDEGFFAGLQYGFFVPMGALDHPDEIFKPGAPTGTAQVLKSSLMVKF